MGSAAMGAVEQVVACLMAEAGAFEPRQSHGEGDIGKGVRS